MKTALIAAGGYGTRFFGYKNLSGKGFIDVHGESIFSYVATGLKDGGIEKLVIAANKDNWKKYSKFGDFIETEIFIDNELKGIVYLTYLLESRLPEQYFLVYCHQPITSCHLDSQREKNRDESIGVSVYPNYEEKKKLPILLNEDDTVKFLQNSEQLIDGYIGVPYLVIGSKMARLGKDDNFKHWSGHYIKKASKEGIAVIGTVADMFPEMDFPHQFPQVVNMVLSDNRFRPLSRF